ncbi:MAG: hypothetical protein NTV87_02450 [Ignavibacteriae bacterium]|nr:hypothetical protein [Ignavibacteriota bacterium]
MFDTFVVPPGQDHVNLLIVVQIISLLMFLPFSGMMLGGSVFSVYFNRKGKKTGNQVYKKFYFRLAKDIADKLTVSKSAGYALGILPLASAVFIYAQILYGAKVISVSLLFLSLILYIAGFILIYNYKHTFRIEGILGSLKNAIGGQDKLSPELREYEKSLTASNSRYGSYGIITLFSASFLFVAGTTIASDPASWAAADNILKLFISGKIWINYFYFLSASFAVTGGAMLYLFFEWEGGIANADAEYKSIIKSVAIPSAFIGSLLQPLFLFLGVLLLAEGSLSSSVFVYAGLTLFTVFLVCNFLYYVYKNSEFRFSGIIFFLMFLAFAFTIVKDEMTFRNAVKEHLLVVNAKADELAKEQIGSIVQVNAADGEKIYNEKCIACHKFDQKVVGPPYQETVPKYNGENERRLCRS